MNRNIPVNIEDTNAEVIARIAKSAAVKYDCVIDIDFNNGKREIKFDGDETLKQQILEDVIKFFPRG